MKRITLFFLFLFSLNTTFAQSDTAVVYTDAYFNVVKQAKADFILKSYKVDSSSYVFVKYDKKKVLLLKETYADQALQVKHGAYCEYKNGKPVYKGTYIRGNREGTFVRYDTLRRVLETKSFVGDSANGPNVIYWANGNKREEGNYLDNARVGLWVKYYQNGNVAVKETLSAQKIDVPPSPVTASKNLRDAYKKLRYLDSAFFDIDGKPTTREKVETKISYAGGIEKFYQFLGEHIKYPLEAMEQTITGIVFISFSINEKGAVDDVRVERTPHPLLAKEAIRVVNLTNQWTPATFAGEKVRTEIHVPIKFSVN